MRQKAYRTQTEFPMYLGQDTSLQTSFLIFGIKWLNEINAEEPFLL